MGGLGGAAVKGTSQVIDTAGDVVRGVAAAGRAVVEEIQKGERAESKEDGRGDAEGADESSEAEESSEARETSEEGRETENSG